MQNFTSNSCSDEVLHGFSKRMERQTLQVNGIMLLNVIVMGAVVFVGVCAPRYRRHPFVGFIFQGANTLFLPISTIVAGTVTLDLVKRFDIYLVKDKRVIAGSAAGVHNFLILLWTGLVILVAISTYAVVAVDPREGRSISFATELLTKAIWVAYLIVGGLFNHEFFDELEYLAKAYYFIKQSIRVREIFGALILITVIKIYQKYMVFYVARSSFMLGRNPRLIVAYMAKLEQVQGNVVSPPSLVVMEGVPMALQQQPLGYSYILGESEALDGGTEDQQSCIRRYFRKQSGTVRRIKRNEGSELVSLDTVWGLDDNCFLSSTQQAKDLCFSFALFKMLRCRFAKYTVSEAGFMKASNFFWHTYLRKGADNYSRVFRVIADELSFLHDCYYSSISIPFSNLHFLLTIFFNHVLSIGFCSYMLVFMILAFSHALLKNQVVYLVQCTEGETRLPTWLSFGCLWYDVVPVFLILAALLFSEIKETVAFFCSNFTKVVLVCNHVRRPRCPKLVASVFKHLRCSWLLDPWDDKMSQCKILVFHPWKVSVLLRRLLHLPNQKKVKVPSEAKKAIFEALQGLETREKQQGQALKHIRLPSSPNGDSTVDAQSACKGKGIADTILAWHIATSMFEVKDPKPNGYKTAAVRLSDYCAYLVCCRPELLPDDAEWCKTLHEAVSKDAAEALASRDANSTDPFKNLVELLSESKHEVLRQGATLAKELEKNGWDWEKLSQFWSEMILYIAPSEKLDEHAEAISRGGELITLVWALLTHAGVVERPQPPNAAATTDAGRVNGCQDMHAEVPV